MCQCFACLFATVLLVYLQPFCLCFDTLKICCKCVSVLQPICGTVSQCKYSAFHKLPTKNHVYNNAQTSLLQVYTILRPYMVTRNRSQNEYMTGVLCTLIQCKPLHSSTQEVYTVQTRKCIQCKLGTIYSANQELYIVQTRNCIQCKPLHSSTYSIQYTKKPVTKRLLNGHFLSA